KARQALTMDVYPGLKSDRAENVLHDIEMARANVRLQVPPAPAVPAPSAGADVGLAIAPADQPGTGLPLPAATDVPVTDPAVQKTSGNTAEGGPDLTAPANDKPANAAAGSQAPLASSGPGAVEPPGPIAPPEPPVAAAPAPAQAPPGNRGEQLLGEAKALYAS